MTTRKHQEFEKLGEAYAIEKTGIDLKEESIPKILNLMSNYLEIYAYIY